MTSGSDSNRHPAPAPAPAPERRRRPGLWLALAGVPAALLLVAGLGVWASRAADPAPAVLGVQVTPDKAVHIGTRVEARLRVRLPWYRVPRTPFQIQAPDGVQAVRADRRRLHGIGWLTWTWDCTAFLQPVQTGTISGMKLAVLPSAGRRAERLPAALNADLPSLNVQPHLAGDDTLQTAGEIRLPWWSWQRWRWWHILAALVLGALLVWALLSLFIRKALAPAAAPPPEPAWDRAVRELEELRASLPLPPAAFFVRLTDLVRAYCEVRFGLRATESTTPEFMRLLRRNPVLAPAQQARLEEMLNQADAIKFAKGAATDEQLAAALVSARRFVEETIPPPPPQNSAVPVRRARS